MKKLGKEKKIVEYQDIKPSWKCTCNKEFWPPMLFDDIGAFFAYIPESSNNNNSYKKSCKWHKSQNIIEMES